MCWDWEISAVLHCQTRWAVLKCLLLSSLAKYKQTWAWSPYSKCQINFISVTTTWCDHYDLQNYAWIWYSQNALHFGWHFLHAAVPGTMEVKTYKLVMSIYFRLSLIHPKKLSANSYGLFFLSVKDTRQGKRRQHSLPVCSWRFTVNSDKYS